MVVAKDKLIGHDGHWKEKGDTNGNGQTKHAQLDGNPVGKSVLPGRRNLSQDIIE